MPQALDTGFSGVVLVSVVSSARLHEGYIQATHTQVVNKDTVVCPAFDQTPFETITADDTAKRMRALRVEFGYLGISASEQGGSASGTSALKIEEGTRELGEGVTSEGLCAVETILFTVIQKEQDTTMRQILLFGEV
jgi:hypothetical protein